MSARRPVAIVLIVAGALVLADVAATVAWQEPVGALTARRDQRQARAELAALVDVARREGRARGVSSRLEAAAARSRRRATPGHPAGEIVIPRIGLRAVLVDGSDPASLRRGPGIYDGSPFPGEGGTVAIAGHRTTHGAPFRRVDRLTRGDRILVRMPYGTLRYVVRARRVVDPADVSIVRRVRSGERLVLSACHPLFSARQRIVVLAARV